MRRRTARGGGKRCRAAGVGGARHDARAQTGDGNRDAPTAPPTAQLSMVARSSDAAGAVPGSGRRETGAGGGCTPPPRERRPRPLLLAPPRLQGRHGIAWMPLKAAEALPSSPGAPPTDTTPARPRRAVRPPRPSPDPEPRRALRQSTRSAARRVETGARAPPPPAALPPPRLSLPAGPTAAQHAAAYGAVIARLAAHLNDARAAALTALAATARAASAEAAARARAFGGAGWGAGGAGPLAAPEAAAAGEGEGAGSAGDDDPSHLAAAGPDVLACALVAAGLPAPPAGWDTGASASTLPPGVLAAALAGEAAARAPRPARPPPPASRSAFDSIDMGTIVTPRVTTNGVDAALAADGAPAPRASAPPPPEPRPSADDVDEWDAEDLDAMLRLLG